jgi:DNA-binding LacI/PurR family transcriptional regulator
MNDAGLEVRDQWVVWHQLDKPITSDLLAPLFNNGPDKPDAIFAINDSFAALLIELLLERQISVPDDVSVVGMGDLRITRTCGITTMREPLEDIGREAAEILMELIKNPDHEPLRKKLYCNDLIIRRTA